MTSRFPVAILCLTGAIWGQDPAPQQPPPQNQPAGKQPDKSKAAKKQTKLTSNDRLFFALPNFMTVENAADAPPLTAAQKFKETARGTFDPVQFLWSGAQAGISQAQNHDAEYGQGAEGYAKRFGVRFADGTVENFFTRAIFPAVLHQDPRYFQLGEGRFWHRALYAVGRIFVTRTDSGGNEFNFSEIVGSATAAGISAYTYRPESSRNLSSALAIWGTQVGYDALGNGLKEFWPDIRRKIHASKSGGAGSQTKPGGESAH
jgi:hypothetical protein